ncbi:MAG: hypothetical protein JXQ73_32205 [Phycisphaerae bacterium]|nr:hypothetical protein [Phycisphaerae bacterium]
MAADVVDVGSRRELLVDRFLIDKLENASLQMHPPTQAGTALIFDKPWEGRYCGYVTVIEDGGTYRMYYRGLPEAKPDGSTFEVTCMAESPDGITWTKPKLGLFEAGGSRDNNVVLHGHAPCSHNFSPFIDTRPGVAAAERFKAVGGTMKTGLIPFVSADGIRWKKLQDKPILTEGALDSQNVIFWSRPEQCYVCYFRSWSGGGYKGIRTISRCTSKDFLEWSKPLAMTFGDTPMEHLYTNQTRPYFRADHLYVAVCARFMPGRKVLTDDQIKALGIQGQYGNDCSDAVLLTSRGGNRYDRTFMESFIRPGCGLSNWNSRTNYPAYGVIKTGPDEMSIYVQKGYGQPTHHLVRYALRLDGFASVSAPYRGGQMITKPLTFTGKMLEINYATSAAGGIRVEIQDAAGKPIPGYALADAIEIIGDEIERVVAWKGGADLGKLAGNPVRLRFVMKDADLFSIRFR